MRNSKIIKEFIIKNGPLQLKLSTGYEFDRMLERISRAVFGKDDVSINESLAIGFLFDNDLFSNLHVAVNYEYFYECKPAGAIVSVFGNESDVKECQAMIDETIEFLKKHEDLLRTDECLSYEDLTLSKYGRIAEEFDTFMADLFNKHEEIDKFILVLKKHYSVESLKDKRVAERVLEMIGTYSDVKNFMLYIIDNSRYNLLIKDVYLPMSRAERLQQCVDQIFECNSGLMIISNLSEEEYDKVYNVLISRDTELLAIDLN